MKIQPLLLAVAAATAMTTPALVQAATGTWTGATSNEWRLDSNWTASPFPGSSANETATFNGTTAITTNISTALANPAAIVQRGLGDVTITGANFNTTRGITFGVTGQSLATGNVTIASMAVINASTSLGAASAGTTAGILDFAGGITTDIPRTISVTSNFDGALRFSSLAATPSHLRISIARNQDLNQNMFIDFNVDNFGMDRVSLIRSTQTNGYLIFRAIGSSRTMTFNGTSAAILSDSTVTIPNGNLKFGFAGSNNLTMNVVNGNFFQYSANSTSLEIEQNSTGNVVLNGNFTLSGGNPGAVATLSLTGSGSGSISLAGIVQDPLNATASGITLARNSGTITRFTANNTFAGTVNLASGTLVAEMEKGLGNSANVLVGGGVLNVRGVSAGALSLGANANFSMTSGEIQLQLGTDFDRILGNGSGAFNLSGGSIALDVSGSGFDYGSTYAIFQGFGGLNSVSSLNFSGFDTGGYAASLDTSGVLSFTPVPEPSAIGLLLLATGGFLAMARARRCCR